MPYIEQTDREIIQKRGLKKARDYVKGLTDQKKKGFVAWAVMWFALTVFEHSYFGISTATDAVRSALVEMEKLLAEYEERKKHYNGGVI